MVLDSSLSNIQHYKLRVKGKFGLSIEKCSAFSYNISVVAIEKRAIGSPSTKVTNFTYFIFM